MGRNKNRPIGFKGAKTCDRLKYRCKDCTKEKSKLSNIWANGTIEYVSELREFNLARLAPCTYV